MNTEQRISHLEAENKELRKQIADLQAKEKAANEAAEVRAAEDAKVMELQSRGLTREQAISKLKRQREFDARKKNRK